MSDRIRIPFRSRSQAIDAEAISDLPRMLDGEERAIARQVLLNARESGVQSVGELLDRLEAADSSERREVLDQARAAVGLETIAAREEKRERLRALRWPPPPPRGPMRDSEGKALQVCAAKNCETMPVSPRGLPKPVAARRWWCEQHRDQAEPGDLDPIPGINQVRVDALGFPRMSPEAEQHYEREYRRVEEEGARRRAERAAERERLARIEQEYRAGLQAPSGFSPREAQ
jgi:hypothetical protein